MLMMWHLRKQRMYNLMLPDEVERDPFFPAFLRSIQRQWTAASGAVDQNVDPAEPGERSVAHSYCRVRRHNVSGDQQRKGSWLGSMSAARSSS
jgi:hypothetical protein